MRIAAGALCSSVALLFAPLDAQQCRDGRDPVTEVGLRVQRPQQILTAATNNPIEIAYESAQNPVRYLRVRLTARSLGSGEWHTTVRDLRGHPLQTFSRRDFEASRTRWSGRIPGAVASIDLTVIGSAASPELEASEYVAMPTVAKHPYYSVKQRGNEDWRPLYASGPGAVDAKFRPWGDAVAFVMGSWGDRMWGCSGAVVGPNLLLTAWHCGGAGSDRMPETAYWNPDVCNDLLVDLSWDDDGSSRDYTCVRVVDKNKDRDFALLEIAPLAATGEARPFALSPSPLAAGAPLFLIHHPLYMQKQFTRLCSVGTWPFAGWTTAASTSDFTHDCDSEGGSSGAPVFNAAGQIVGLHHFGHAVDPATCRDADAVNKAVRIGAIVDFLEANRAANGNVVDKLSIVR